MKNKGFTLVELLAILGVLAVITLITVPIIDSTIKKNKEKLYNSQINSIKASLKTWGDDNIESLPVDENTPLNITLGRLKSDGLVDIDIKNPKTKKCFPNNMILTIKKTGNGYEYFVDAESGDERADDCSIPTTE